MAKIQSRSERKEYLFRVFAQIFPKGVNANPESPSEPQHIEGYREAIFAEIKSICPNLHRVEQEITDACEFYISAHRQRASRSTYADLKRILNGSRSTLGLIGTIDAFIQECDSHINDLYFASGSDLAGFGESDEILPRSAQRSDVKHEFDKFQNAMDGDPAGHEPSMQDLLNILAVKNNRLKLFSKQYHQVGRTPDTALHDFIFYLADIFEDCDVELFPGAKRRQERTAFLNVIRYLFDKMPDDVWHLKSDTPGGEQDTFSKFVRNTLNKKEGKKTQFKMSSFQLAQYYELLSKLAKLIKFQCENSDPGTISLTSSDHKFIKRHRHLFPDEWLKSLNI